MHPPLIVGIAGGTASGKTTIATAYAARHGALLVAHDRYYRTFADPSHANFDHPDSLETDLLVEHLDALKGGRAVPLPRYDFATHRRLPEVDPARLPDPPVVVVEGILVLAHEGLRGLFDLTVFVDVPDDIRLLRRVVRDIHERGRTVESVAGQYLESVRPMHEAFVRPSAGHARLTLDGQAPVDTQVDRLHHAVRARRS